MTSRSTPSMSAVPRSTGPHSRPRREALDDLAPQLGLVEETRGLGVPVQVARVGRGPPVVRTASEVPGHDVRVQQRIAGAGGAVTERGRDEPIAADLDRAAGAAAAPAGFALEVLEPGLDRGIVRLAELPHGLRVGDAPQDADGLRCAECQIESCDRAFADRLAQPGTGEHLGKLARLDLATEASLFGRAPSPTAGSFTLPGVVVLTAERDLIGVVPGSTGAGLDLADGEHLLAQSRKSGIAPRRVSGVLTGQPHIPKRASGESSLGRGAPPAFERPRMPGKGSRFSL